MRIAIYGLPSSGKTTLIEGILNAKKISGRQALEQLSDGTFADMTEEEKRQIRIQFTRKLSELTDALVVCDGHYSFVDNVVFTPSDGDVYDVFFYLYCSPSELKHRYESSEKNQKYSSLSEETIKQWQEFEIEALRSECHARNKDFYVISDNNKSTVFYSFLDEVVRGFSSLKLAEKIVKRIIASYPVGSNPTIYITDGDKTIIEQDSFRFCFNGKTSVFDGDFYTGYQSYLYSNELSDFSAIPDSINDINLNADVWSQIKGNAYVVISSGITAVWNRLKETLDLAEVIADPLISADTKYYVVKQLKANGYIVHAFGDSKNDYYMLKEADYGYLYIGNRISRSLTGVDLNGLRLLYDKSPYYLINDATEENMLDISICKSNSGINGNRLALSHLRLGQSLGRRMASSFPATNTAILVLERGGRFFGDGVYSTFGGVLYPFNPSKDSMPNIKQDRVIIVDSVINTGKSILKIVSQLKEADPNREIVIVSNVVQSGSIDLLSDYKIYAVRSSANSFVGRRQAVQKGNSGPDTADRLFNLINRSF